MRIKTGTIALIADGAKMLLLRNEGDTVDPDFKVIDHETAFTPANRDILTDAPGVTHAGHPGGRSIYGNDDPHRRAEARFAQAAAQVLAKAADTYDSELIVVAPPQSLAVLRHHFGPAVKSRLVAEIDKDLTRHPVAEITRRMAAFEPTANVRRHI